MKNEKYIDSDGQELTKRTWPWGSIEYINGQGFRHRLDGPASIGYGGTEYWYKNGKPHREDGPAIVYLDGREEYRLNGERVSKREIDLLWLKKQVAK